MYQIKRNPTFCSLASFWIISLTPFNNEPESSKDLTILIMPSISSFDIISVAVPDPKIFLCIPASVADAAVVNPNKIKMLLANGLIAFIINSSPVFNNVPRSLSRNPPDCIVLDSWVFDNLISIDALFAKTLHRLATCLLVNNLLGKLVSSSELRIFYDNLKTTSALFFIAAFNLLTCEFDSFTFKLL